MIFNNLGRNISVNFKLFTFFLIPLGIIYFYGLDFLSFNVKERYYVLSVLTLSFGFPIVLYLIFSFFKDINKAFILLICLLPLVPSVGFYLRALGSELLSVTLELIIILLFFISIHLVQKTKHSKSLLIFCFLWFVANTGSLLLSENILISFPSYMLSVSLILFAISLSAFVKGEGVQSNIDKRLDLTLRTYVLSVSVFAIACMSLIFLNFGFGFLSSLFSLFRITLDSFPGLMTNNLISSVLLISIPIWVTLLSHGFNEKRFLRSLLPLFIFCVSILLIFLDKSRGAFIVLIFYLVIFILRFLLSSLANPKNQFRNQSYLMSFTILVILALGFIFLGEVVFNRMTGLNTGQFSFKDIIQTTFLSARGLTITQGFQEFLNSPFFGKGYGNGLMYIPTFGVYWNSHNLIMEHLVATGIFGITPIFYLLVSAFLSSVKSRRKLTSHDKDLIFSLWLSIAGFFLFGVTSGFEFIAAYDIKTAYYSYTLLLFLIAIMTITENRRKFR